MDCIYKPDKLSLFLTNLVHDVPFSAALGVVENIKPNSLTLALGFRKNAILAFRASLDPNIVVGDTLQHILTLSYVNNLFVQLDAIDAWVFVFWSQSVPAKHGTNIFYKLILQFLTTLETSDFLFFISLFLYLTYILEHIFYKKSKKTLISGLLRTFTRVYGHDGGKQKTAAAASRIALAGVLTL